LNVTIFAGIIKLTGLDGKNQFLSSSGGCYPIREAVLEVYSIKCSKD